MNLQRLRSVTRADVYKAGVLAAHLSRDDSGTATFSYVDEYLGPAVATTLPIDAPPVMTPNGALPPFFSGLLPEGHRLSVLKQALKTSFDDELSLLLAVGSDVPGDVQVVPQGEKPVRSQPAIVPSQKNVKFRDIVDLIDLVGIPGVQTKASASMANSPVSYEGKDAILKIDPPEHPYLVENEALHLRTAKMLKIPVSDAEVIHDAEGVSGLLVTRFDRPPQALEDAAQVMGVPPARKYSVTSEEVVLALTQHTQAPAVAKQNLYLQLLFAWLTGNGDLHAKNVSILHHRSGWEIAPVYDIPCTLLYGDATLALELSGKTKNLRLRHWDDFAVSIGLPLKAARKMNDVALKTASNIDLSTLQFRGSPLYAAERELRHRRYTMD